ncbi:MAG: acyl carrier protein [Clostridia bacterium]|nr:acyl carrier protein [Clostridia bacterium]
MLEKIKGMIADALMIDESEITEGTRFIEDLHADSLDIVQLIIAMEREFGKRFSDEEIAKIKTVGDVLTYLK